MPRFYTPTSWRTKADNVKQGSSDNEIDYYINSYTRSAIAEYQRMLDVGIAPEMARMVLPQNMYTEWYWSGSLYAFARVVNQRVEDTAQKHSWEALTGYSKPAPKNISLEQMYENVEKFNKRGKSEHA
jgi:thymidylate synthase (FAD)